MNLRDSRISNGIRGLKTNHLPFMFLRILTHSAEANTKTQQSEVLAGLLTKGNI